MRDGARRSALRANPGNSVARWHLNSRQGAVLVDLAVLFYGRSVVQLIAQLSWGSSARAAAIGTMRADDVRPVTARTEGPDRFVVVKRPAACELYQPGKPSESSRRQPARTVR